MSQKIFDELRDSITDFDKDRAAETAKKALEMGIDPVEAIEKGLSKGLEIIGERFENGDLFIMHLVAAGAAVKETIDTVLKPELEKSGKRLKSAGVVMLATVEGDIHDIGKNLVGVMLIANGFEVYDLGQDVSTQELVEKVKEHEADILGLSAMLSTTILVQREVIKALEDAELRDSIKVIVGGVAATKDWAEEIGADGYAEDANVAVALVKKIMSEKA